MINDNDVPARYGLNSCQNCSFAKWDSSNRCRETNESRFGAQKVLVIFCEPTAVTIRSIASQIMNRESLTRLILVVQNQMTNQAQKAVDLFSFKVEIFQITDLLVNITKHVLKPTHRVLNDKEKQNLLKKFSLEEKQIPRMLQKDAIARYYGREKGQVVKVSYSDEITESHVTYRCDCSVAKTRVFYYKVMSSTLNISKQIYVGKVTRISCQNLYSRMIYP
ncbi:hypothetical protein HYC85_003224 [Camellia sinensis]|uniref:RNA polymerase subunit H/Rpb5 C-terminal domain-containing protein n=1 Tax=Camellia sinensis TaxID=4442 RepID=A0A7J7IAW3_CAMSI|nr:hypothetical protein HYC85_003224 [Camellia sinensis]